MSGPASEITKSGLWQAHSSIRMQAAGGGRGHPLLQLAAAAAGHDRGEGLVAGDKKIAVAAI